MCAMPEGAEESEELVEAVERVLITVSRRTGAGGAGRSCIGCDLVESGLASRFVCGVRSRLRRVELDSRVFSRVSEPALFGASVLVGEAAAGETVTTGVKLGAMDSAVSTRTEGGALDCAVNDC